MARRRLRSDRDADAQHARRVHGQAVARCNDRGGLAFLDDGGSDDLDAFGKRVSVEHRGVDEAVAEPRGARTLACGPARGGAGLPQRQRRDRAAAAHPERDELHGHAVVHRRVARGVGDCEGVAERGHGGRVDAAFRHADGDLVQLAEQAHVGHALAHDVGFGDAAGDQAGAGFAFQLAQHRVDGVGRAVPVEPDGVAAHLLERERGGEEAQGRRGAGGGRDQHLRHAERARDPGGMGRSGAAEPDHGIGARVAALLDDVDARGGGHAFRHHAMDAPGGLHGGQPERPADAVECRRRGTAVQRHAAAEEEAGVVVAEQEVGVGHGRLGASAPVAGRAGRGAGGMRADAEQAHLVDPGDGAAAGADLDHVDHRRLDRQAGALLEAMHPGRLHLGGDGGLAAFDQAGFGRGAAHVEADHVGHVRHRPKERGGEPAAGGAGFEQADREGARRLGRDQAAGGVHEPQRAAEPELPQLALQAPDVAVHQRLDEGVRAGGGKALILPQLGNHVRRQADGHVGQCGADGGPRGALVGGIPVRMQEAHGDGVHAVGGEAARLGGDRVEVERDEGVAVAVHALGHLQPAAARHQRLGILQEQVVDVVALLGAHLQDVAEALGGDEAEAGAAPLDQRVGHQRRAVDDLAHVGQRQAGIGHDLRQALQRADRGVVRSGEAFVQPDAAINGVEQDEVGEGAADVEADAEAGHAGMPSG